MPLNDLEASTSSQMKTGVNAVSATFHNNFIDAPHFNENPQEQCLSACHLSQQVCEVICNIKKSDSESD